MFVATLAYSGVDINQHCAKTFSDLTEPDNIWKSFGNQLLLQHLFAKAANDLFTKFRFIFCQVQRLLLYIVFVDGRFHFIECPCGMVWF